MVPIMSMKQSKASQTHLLHLHLHRGQYNPFAEYSRQRKRAIKQMAGQPISYKYKHLVRKLEHTLPRGMRCTDKWVEASTTHICIELDLEDLNKI